ncbi:hypothetical protein Aperf_G00000116198 [Anoplocephala perfoliata]
MSSSACLCGPDGFVIQGSYSVSSKGLEIKNEKDDFVIRRMEIDLLELISPPQTAAVQSNGVPNNTRRRYGKAPANWYTIGIGTKDFLFYEISFYYQLEQRTVYSELHTLINEPIWKTGDFLTSYSVTDNTELNEQQVFSPKIDFASEISSKQLRVSDANYDFQVCSSYPQLMIVPASVDDSVITSAARLRYGSRFPLIKYFHAPKSTILATASRKMSSNFLKSSQSPLTNDASPISSSIQSSVSTPEMQANGQLLDAMLSSGGRGLAINLANEGSSQVAVSSSNVKSTKKESAADLYDKGWKPMPKPLPDPLKIHEIFVQFIKDITTQTGTPLNQNSNSGFNLPTFLRSSARRVPAIATTEEDDAMDKSAFATVKVSLKKTTAWLGLVRDSLAIASTAACALSGRDRSDKTGDGLSVLLISNEGSDRCLLISSLTQIIISPKARTIHGFAALVERDWIAAGHPFGRRCSRLLTQPSDQMKEAAPIFLLFLDCVWQIWCQYPSSFEFNEELLLLLAKHVYLCDFRTFIGDSDAMRNDIPQLMKKPSFWSYVNCPEVYETIQNCLYVPPNNAEDPNAATCWPCVNSQAINVWREVYQRVLLPYPCKIWSEQRKALMDANSEFKGALETVRALEKKLTHLINMAKEANYLPEC